MNRFIKSQLSQESIVLLIDLPCCPKNYWAWYKNLYPGPRGESVGKRVYRSSWAPMWNSSQIFVSLVPGCGTLYWPLWAFAYMCYTHRYTHAHK